MSAPCGPTLPGVSCDWPVDRTCMPTLPVLPEEPTDADLAAVDAAQAAQDDAAATAVQIMWALSGRQFGVCPVIYRPTPVAERAPCPGGGSWVLLPGPVAAVVSVSVGGAVIDPSSYRVEGDRLYRTGGYQWPAQNLDRPDGDPGTWSVTYRRGLPVPAGVGRLTGALARELLSACDGGKCRLPRSVVSTTQRGVTHVFDPAKILGAGKTGIPEIDSWLAAVNPHRLAEPVVVVL